MDKYIRLPIKDKNRESLVVLIDKEDFEKVSKYKWYALHSDKWIYAIAGTWDTEIKKTKKILMHRLITRALPNELVDHINHKTLDNRKENLRICTPQQSVSNITIHKNNTTGYKGVYLIKNKRENSLKWRARLFLNKKEYVTYHRTKEEAAKSYDAMAEKYFGEFAFTNKDIKNNLKKEHLI